MSKLKFCFSIEIKQNRKKKEHEDGSGVIGYEIKTDSIKHPQIHNQTIHLNINRFNHRHWHVFYCQQKLCGEIKTVNFCSDKPIIGIMAINGSMHTVLPSQPAKNMTQCLTCEPEDWTADRKQQRESFCPGGMWPGRGGRRARSGSRTCVRRPCPPARPAADHTAGTSSPHPPPGIQCSIYQIQASILILF